MKNKGNGTAVDAKKTGPKGSCRHRSWDQCPVMRALDLIANKWTVPVIYNLYCPGEALRFGELQRRIETITALYVERYSWDAATANLKPDFPAPVLDRSAMPRRSELAVA